MDVINRLSVGIASARSQILSILILLLTLFSTSIYASVSDFHDVEKALSKGKFNEKRGAVSWLVTSNNENAEIILNGLLNRKVAYDKANKNLWLLKEKSAVRLYDQQRVEDAKPLRLKKVTINNSVRKAIKEGLARLELSAPDSQKRLDAINRLMTSGLDAPTSKALTELRTTEKNESVKQAIELALAAHALSSATLLSDEAVLSHIALLGDSAHPYAQQVLNKAKSENNSPAVSKAITLALTELDQHQRLMQGVETLYFGISLGSVLVLAGIGLAITFGVMGVINMAHGELVMIGAYCTYVMQQLLPNDTGLALLLSIPAAFVVAGAVGMLIERTVIRHLYGRPLETLLATFGISLILQQAVRSIFSPLNRSVSTPDFMSGMLEISPMLSLTWNRLYIIGFCLIVFFGLLMVLKKTPLGLQVRAVSQNRAMARAMGVRSERVDVMTFGIGAGVAGIAGVALSQLTNVGPNMGQAYIIDSFMVVVFGGVGNLWGTLVAGLSLGVFNKLLEPWAGAVLAKILVLVFIILFIQKRPKGLFPQRGRMAEG
ncbi:urea ABC transporter permease subunit UrtB [Veronia nyctiphanis]|uniref:Urea ABC transporter permease subunit UrtB n=1 Tax=Veronia nyctiphanis TaxID=1278244 RepID=A0A4Q0YSF7_9GAMM|nr:urea ABC transporter permease subunit UrtB [Veronia nyctiphanis]RXJ74177.1 urea ABC transporter permease subunit UrtB [Veronia nyctiphanis]